MNIEIKTKSGLISAYGLACGYVQIYSGNYYSLELYKKHGQYIISYYNSITHKHICTFESKLTSARAEYNRLFNEIIIPLINN